MIKLLKLPQERNLNNGLVGLYMAHAGEARKLS